jgi:hypothetical protein
MSLDGFMAGPGHDTEGMTGFTGRPGLLAEYIRTTGAVLGGRDEWGEAVATGARPYGGAWERPIVVLTHHPEDAPPASSPTPKTGLGGARPLPPRAVSPARAPDSTSVGPPPAGWRGSQGRPGQPSRGGRPGMGLVCRSPSDGCGGGGDGGSALPSSSLIDAAPPPPPPPPQSLLNSSALTRR